ncbi:MAG: hypothetical protein KKB59_18430 [Spirochaetes bacterium]|nr:hypothetical protein [Spirochaetota bacterium]
METKIGEVKGYTIVYDSRDRLFCLRDKDGADVGSGATQEEVEKKADVLAKQSFKFPIPALESTGRYLQKGKITSFNIDNKSAQFVYEDRTYGSHTKIHLRHDKVHELTPQNEEISKEVTARRNKIAEIETEVGALISKLEKPINLSYFGLKDTY